jgi:hypothetical protein
MYSVLDDQRQAKKVIEYMSTKSNCRIKDIIQDCYIARTRLAYLERQGYLSLPEKTPFGERNGRKNN